MKITLIVILVVVVLGGLIVFGSVKSTYNNLATEREAIKAQWSQVDNVLQRRADLIPNLVQTVKGFAKHEETVFKDIADARSALLGGHSPQEKIDANGRLDSAIGRLLVLQENYPQLRSNENFLRLQDELSGTENRIAIERQKYNESVQRYNTDLSLFPNNIIAGMFGFQHNDAYFKTEPAARQTPKVQF